MTLTISVFPTTEGPDCSVFEIVASSLREGVSAKATYPGHAVGGIVDEWRARYQAAGHEVEVEGWPLGSAHPQYERGFSDGANQQAGYQFGERELAMVLAALRAVQNVQQHEALAPEIVEIATDGGRFTMLDDGEIDTLCDTLNDEGATMDLEAQLRRLFANGLDQGTTMRALGQLQAATRPGVQPFLDALPDAIQNLRASDGDIDTDDIPLVSESDAGAYVSAWIWVSNEDAGIEGEGGEDDDGEDGEQ